MRGVVMGFLGVFLFAIVVTAQSDQAKKQSEPGKKAAPSATSSMMPKPALELKRIAYLAGDWTFEGSMQPSDFGPGGKFNGKEHNEWYPGRFFLVSKGDMTMSGMGATKELAIFGYDSEKKLYTYHAINSIGEAESSTGTVNGADWTWTNDSTRKGKTYKDKFTMHEESPTSYTMKFEESSDGGKTWRALMDGKAVKIGKSAATAK